MLPSCFTILDTCKKVFPSECVWSSPLETRQYVQCAALVYLDPLLEWRLKKKKERQKLSLSNLVHDLHTAHTVLWILGAE